MLTWSVQETEAVAAAENLTEARVRVVALWVDTLDFLLPSVVE
jgi:hypothetical protein